MVQYNASTSRHGTLCLKKSPYPGGTIGCGSPLSFFSYHPSGENGQGYDMAMLHWPNADSKIETKKARKDRDALIIIEESMSDGAMSLSDL